jgi:plastocyanin
MVGQAWMRRPRAGSVLALCALFATYGGAFAQGWGNIKGKVEWTPAAIPAPRNLLVGIPPANIPACVKGGVLPSDELLIDKNTKGVANVMVWLAALKDADKTDKKPGEILIHPDLKAVPKQNVVIDQPCCLFEPRVVIVREGQTLEIRNSAAFAHAFSFSGDPERNGGKNSTIPAGGKATFELKSQKRPLTFSCTLHTWMEGRIVVVNHPYFAITKKDGTFEIKNAPAGKFLLYLSHEKSGWLQKGRASGGQEVEIKAGETLDLGKFSAP